MDIEPYIKVKLHICKPVSQHVKLPFDYVECVSPLGLNMQDVPRRPAINAFLKVASDCSQAVLEC